MATLISASFCFCSDVCQKSFFRSDKENISKYKSHLLMRNHGLPSYHSAMCLFQNISKIRSDEHKLELVRLWIVHTNDLVGYHRKHVTLPVVQFVEFLDDVKLEQDINRAIVCEIMGPFLSDLKNENVSLITSKIKNKEDPVFFKLQELIKKSDEKKLPASAPSAPPLPEPNLDDLLARSTVTAVVGNVITAEGSQVRITGDMFGTTVSISG
ncbi:MAG: hypothetical protein Edafosvirus5_5 [Edafosvirus sp.]|uniref:Uncharacterized protein n=1 Tax=Edafosvirus sp. TaxID=2487765 RepID=A0A3G4ZT87_9VIRU|nr:MAG: hypothetical protein Edafosvirus5_5 [Edafosvirus sp.]